MNYTKKGVIMFQDSLLAIKERWLFCIGLVLLGASGGLMDGGASIVKFTTVGCIGLACALADLWIHRKEDNDDEDEEGAD